MWKRKRSEWEQGGDTGETGEEGEVFKSSKMVQRSPVRGKKEDVEVIGEMIRKMGESLSEEIRGIKEQGVGTKKEMEELREELKEGEKRWREERERIWGRLGELGKKVKELEEGGQEGRRLESRVEELEKERKGEGEEGMNQRLKEMEWKMEKRLREERRNNIVIKGVVVRENPKRSVEEIIERIGAKVEIGEVYKVGKEREGRGRHGDCEAKG